MQALEVDTDCRSLQRDALLHISEVGREFIGIYRLYPTTLRNPICRWPIPSMLTNP